MSTQIEGVPPLLARAAADLTEHGHSFPEALGLSVNTLRKVAAGTAGSPSYKQRNAAREIISAFQSSKSKLSEGQRKSIERIEGSKRPLKPETARDLVQRAEHRLTLNEGVLLAFEKASPKEPILDRVMEAAVKLVGEGEQDEVKARLKTAVEGDRGVVEMFGLVEAKPKSKPVTRREPIPAPSQPTRGENLSRGSGSFDESKHPRDQGKFSSKGGQARARKGAASRSAATTGHEVSQEQIDNLLGELGFDTGDLAAYQKSVGLQATGEIDAVTYNMMIRQAALRNAGPKKGDMVLSADQPSKESGPTSSPKPKPTTTKAKAKKRAKKPAPVQEATATTAWGGSLTALNSAEAFNRELTHPAGEAVGPEDLTDLVGLTKQLEQVVEARKQAQADGDTQKFTRARAREQALRERLAEAEANVQELQEVKSSAYPGLDRSKKENWVDKAGGLPSYIERIAKHLHYEQGMTISHAIASAVNTVKKWCSGTKGDTKPDTKAKACAAVAQWESKKASTKVTEAMDELREAARSEGAWYYPTEDECAAIIEGTEAMKDTYPSIREALQEADVIVVGGIARSSLSGSRSLTKWDPRKHPRNRLGQFANVIAKLTKELPKGYRMSDTGGGRVALHRPSGGHEVHSTPESAVRAAKHYKSKGLFEISDHDTGTLGQSAGKDYGGGAGVGWGHGPVRMRPDEMRGMGAGKGGLDTRSEQKDTYVVDLKDKPLYELAGMIEKDWGNQGKGVNYAARPYLDVLHQLTSHKENYYADSGDMIVRYFLSNATGWRGEIAKSVKAELKARLRETGVRGVEFVAKLDRLEEAFEQRVAATDSGDREAFITAQAREAGLREAVKAAL